MAITKKVLAARRAAAREKWLAIRGTTEPTPKSVHNVGTYRARPQRPLTLAERNAYRKVTHDSTRAKRARADSVAMKAANSDAG